MVPDRRLDLRRAGRIADALLSARPGSRSQPAAGARAAAHSTAVAVVISEGVIGVRVEEGGGCFSRHPT